MDYRTNELWQLRAARISSFINPFVQHSNTPTPFRGLVLPDLWQLEAVRALRAGRDVVVDAPTGAGKTFIFELFQPELRGQAVFTVPTRALANDKLAEWRARGWEVGLSTGDHAFGLDAKTVVATLETQKGRFLRREGPALFVVDEYQMIGDPGRGVNYELALALAPRTTQLLLLSGSVANPQDVAAWLRRIGRDVALVQHRERPVPLEEVDLETLPNKASSGIRGLWPRLIANALRADLGPILMFAPRRKAAEDFATQLAAALPTDAPLTLSHEDQQLAGSALAKLLRQGVAYHHSGLSYAQRAGLIEPLAKRGRLRVVVATMGLAAGINFSMRSVVITGTSYKVGGFDRQVRSDELLQMFGRAGRRGLDDIGYALVTDQPPRLLDARPLQLRRAEPLDWPTLLAVMRAAEGDPFSAALELNRSLFTPREIPLGIEHARTTGPMPCGLGIDMERARFARRGVVEMSNSRGEWQTQPAAAADVALGEALIHDGQWRPALSLARTLDGIGLGNLCKLGTGREKRYGRELPLGTRRADDWLALAPWLRTRLAKSRIAVGGLEVEVFAHLAEWTGGRVVSVEPRGEQLIARFAFDERRVSAWIDEHGAALLDPPTRRALPPACRGCAELPWCESVEIVASPAHTWRRFGLIEADGRPTRRGTIFSFLQHGEGLAVAAALEDEGYAIDDLIFDLANLRAGPRFAGEDSPYGGRLGIRCGELYDRAEIPGYLTLGVPLDYGAGASEMIRAVLIDGMPRAKLLSDTLRAGDFERAFIEWRSLLRQITWAPDFAWDRWRELRAAAERQLAATSSPTVLPPQR